MFWGFGSTQRNCPILLGNTMDIVFIDPGADDAILVAVCLLRIILVGKIFGG